MTADTGLAAGIAAVERKPLFSHFSVDVTLTCALHSRSQGGRRQF